MRRTHLRHYLLTLLLSGALLGCPDDDPEPTPQPSEDVASDAGATGGGHDTADTGGAEDGGTTGGDAGSEPTAEQTAVMGVAESEAWTIEGLTGPVQVLRTEMGVPHIYASNRADVARVLGFVVARDRYFVMDLQRRLGLGTISELLGDAGLSNDMESRSTGITFVADRLVEHMSDDMGEYLDGFAAGVNAYIHEVKEGNLPAPSELDFAATLLGAASPGDLMMPFDRRGLAGMTAVIMYETNYETGDVGGQSAADKVDGMFEGVAFAELRQSGYMADIWNNLRPLFDTSSAAGLGVETAGAGKPGAGSAGSEFPAAWKTMAKAPPELLEHLSERLERFSVKINRDQIAGFGSNAWAVAGSATTDGAALVAGDGHLQLSVPALMYQIGMDTRVFGDNGTHQTGLLLTGMPILAVGTNGKVAWSQVNPVQDITDWYLEELELDADGVPTSSFFQGEQKPLVAIEETYVVADVPALGSVGRTETWTRWTTFDGRFIATIEGRKASEDEELAEGEALVNLAGDLVVPGDTNDDGVITAISFDYTAFDATRWVDALDSFGHAEDVAGFQEATKGMVGAALFSAAADSKGDILYSSYQAIPCRGYLERDADGQWTPGSDPTRLLNGKIYGGFAMPSLPDGSIDEGPGQSDPYQCAVPFAESPQAVSPDRGYVVTANNDPGNLTTDGALHDDKWYLGGPWSSVRASTIARDLEEAIAAGEADAERMSAIQGNKDSRLGELFAPPLVDAINSARSLSAQGGDLEPYQARLVQYYDDNQAAFDEVESRLKAWGDAGYQTASGVETFYEQPTEQDRSDAVATMIYNAWQARFYKQVWDDEPITAWRFSSSRMKTRALHRFLSGRGPTNPLDQASWNAETGEAIFFDKLGTDEVERSRELMLIALGDALFFLRSDPAGPGSGGFGTEDMSKWLWGLRHQVRFESLLASFLGDDPAFGFVAELFSITTEQLPLAEDLPKDDPRHGLKWFPRGGDQWGVDAANPGFGGTNFTHGNGPVMRMVIALKDGQVWGRNIVPGGQSGLTDSPHFSDQAVAWLANETVPLRFHTEDVVEGATAREVYTAP